MRRLALVTVLVLSVTLAAGCAPAVPAGSASALAATAAAQPAAPLTAKPTAPLPTPAPSPTPSPDTSTLGFVGDILMMTGQISEARTDTGYDFSNCFADVAPLFDSVDVMCANFECTLAGAEAGYTQPRATVPPATEDNPVPTAPYQSFNAPDELAQALVSAGLDAATTANNHCLDRGYDGLVRTIAVLRESGLVTTGTADSADMRNSPLIVDANGISVGIVAATFSVNRRDGCLDSAQRGWAATRLGDEDALRADISACRDAGAEFIIVCPHWGVEYDNHENRTQRITAEQLIQLGADAVIGSHPHVVQPIEWLTVAREDGTEVTAPVIYSLGNFISNMSPAPKNYGLFVRLTLTRTEDGITPELAYLPLLCYRPDCHRVLPCYTDAYAFTPARELDGSAYEDMARAYAHVTEICGFEAACLIEEIYDYAG